MPVAPWLHPPNFLGASEAGTSAGLRSRAQAASEAADRLKLAYDSLASHERAQNLAAQRKLDSQQASMELRKQQMQGLQDYRTRRADQFDTEEERRQDASDSLNKHREDALKETTAHHVATEEISADKAQALVNRGEGEFFQKDGNTYIRQNTGYIVKVGNAPRSGTVTLGPDGKPTRYSLPLDNPSASLLMGTNAPAAMAPPLPEQPHLMPHPDNPNALRMGNRQGTLTIGDPTGGAPAPTATGTAAADLLGSSTPDAGTRPAPMPKTKDDLVKGTVYQTSRGPALWDGENFVAQ